ncbi:MAG: pyruvate:ferredoxin (flavodoxin) oxidoreductase [Puniceicoccaceae bacterium]|nr:MAG: pyruvate:ferredoxin (flavodoxin) oxidoreductase [Puniceicoccaceae bacterium]
MIDANEAVASVAFRLNEAFAIYPITPSSPMAELVDEWAAAGGTNLWGDVPEVVQMQSEAGVAGALHGILQGGVLTSSFTASQGLLLMIPNLYKIAGELTPFVLHITARTLATHALSIFGDHSDVMACRQTGCALLASNSAQEAQDLAAVAHAATLETRLPFLHFFDGFRTSHEINRIEPLDDATLAALLDEAALQAFRSRRLTPDAPVLRGTAQNPDVFFQAREAANPFYDQAPALIESVMERFASLTGRRYRLFDYEGHPEADRVVVVMGSAAETAAETAAWLNRNGEKTGVLKVRLYRPFVIDRFLDALPATTRSIAVLDRTKEPGAPADPLFLDVAAAFEEAVADGRLEAGARPKLIAGRYGLGSKDFTPAMALAVFRELSRSQPRRRFTIGINDDVSRSSLDYDPAVDLEPADQSRAVFFGLGSDGTVGANKNTIKIIGEETDLHAQGYFVYDSKKAGAVTISHLRFGPRPIRAPYLIREASFLACHHLSFLDRYEVLNYAASGAVFLLNAPGTPDQIWNGLPAEIQDKILKKRLKVFAIDAYKVAREAGLGGRINTIMQTCFFALSGVIPPKRAIEAIKTAIDKTYGRKGQELVRRNFAGVDQALAGLVSISLEGRTCGGNPLPPAVSPDAPDFVRNVTSLMLRGEGDLLPVSAFPVDGTWETGTTRWEKRNLADEIPVWDPDVCIQCNKCVLVCPHAAIRAKYYEPRCLEQAPETFQSTDFRSREQPGLRYTLQVAPEDCTGCTLCVQVCPAKNKAQPRLKAINMEPQPPLRLAERANYAFFLDLPQPDRKTQKPDVKGSQFLTPLFEYSGACAGCGETPYLKLLSQLFGDRSVIANATGCSSIYGGNLPTTPYGKDAFGRGPAWSNSLFEDNAEFGYGLRLAYDRLEASARRQLAGLAPILGDQLVGAILGAAQAGETDIAAQRARIEVLRGRLQGLDTADAARLTLLADHLVRKSVWIVGGDGWAYDIGFGGLDHVFTSGRNVNILVLDTEVYSNTGGQRSKATPMGAIAKFSMAGKDVPKKDLALMAMNYGCVYVARIAFGARDAQTINAFVEAESYPGVSLIIAYSHCIAHGYHLSHGLEQQKLAVDTGYWPLMRFDPRRPASGKPALVMDSPPPKIDLADYTRNELRYTALEKSNPDRARDLREQSRIWIRQRYDAYRALATPPPAAP